MPQYNHKKKDIQRFSFEDSLEAHFNRLPKNELKIIKDELFHNSGL